MSQLPESDTDRFLDVSEILKDYIDGFCRDDTLCQFEDYVRTLPGMIPEQSRRDIVSKIMVAAGLDKEKLIGDGEKRMDILSEYARNFSANTDTFVFPRLDEIEKLEKRISELQSEIKSRHDLQEKQTAVLNNEMKRLETILTFLAEL